MKSFELNKIHLHAKLLVTYLHKYLHKYLKYLIESSTIRNTKEFMFELISEKYTSVKKNIIQHVLRRK